jgi:putative membrane protein
MATDRRTSRGSRAPLHEVGENPDYRFTLANERTFLAWVRTALALMAAGVAVVQFVPGLTAMRHVLGFILIGLGGVVAAIAYAQWERNERAMRLGERLPHSSVPRIVSGALALTAFVALGLVAYDMLD